MKNAVARVYGKKIGEITQRAEQLQIKLERILNRIGADAELEGMLDELKIEE